MTVFVSEEFNLGDKLDELEILDSLMDEDSNFFINIKRLQVTKILEFQDSYDKINDYFRKIGILLKGSNGYNDKNYKTAIKKFNFSEVKGINLGFSKGHSGAGFGKILSEQIIKDAFEIIKSGSEYPEIFHLTSLFEENVGPDRLSDMIATLIYEDIVQYTKNAYEKLGINQKNYPHYKFESGLLVNPYKGSKLLLLPLDILHELPIAKDWEDIDRVVIENQAIKSEVNELVGDEWKKLASSKKKYYIKEFIFKNPNIMENVIENYRKVSIERYDVNQNIDYHVRKIFNSKIRNHINFNQPMRNSFDSAVEVIKSYKHWVENQKGYSVLENASSKKKEKIVQKTIHLSALHYCYVKNLDISPESDTGRGPVDFKIARGNDKTVIEIKLTSNNKTVHGFEVQIEEYAESEGTQNKVFLLVDDGNNSYRVDQIKQKYEEKKTNRENPAYLLVIDAKPKKSASNYDPKEH